MSTQAPSRVIVSEADILASPHDRRHYRFTPRLLWRQPEPHTRAAARRYRYIRLQNSLEALLIHDATADVSAAALDCRVGHFSDPSDLPGLAHLTEHMLFLGTAKYPEEDYFRSYLTQHGGSTNASTSTENTRYHFEGH